MSAPPDLTPREAASRYLDLRRTEISDETFTTYRYRLKIFVEWCEERAIESVSDLDGWALDEFRVHRAGQGISPNSLHNELDTLRLFVRYLDRIGLTDGLEESVDVPEVPKGERSRETRLDPDRAMALLRTFRESEQRGNRYHTLLELLWQTGARVGAVRGLDIRDVELDENVIFFRHRPETGTPLKKKRSGERPVGIHPEVTAVLRKYLRHYRPDGHDEHGRQPFLVTTRHTRPSANTLRMWTYEATQPCLFGPCPHGFSRPSCHFREHGFYGGCPSARAPHHIRTGSIIWHRDRGWPLDLLAERANASESTLEEYYDKATKRERMEHRRRKYSDNLGLNDEN